MIVALLIIIHRLLLHFANHKLCMLCHFIYTSLHLLFDFSRGKIKGSTLLPWKWFCSPELSQALMINLHLVSSSIQWSVNPYIFENINLLPEFIFHKNPVYICTLKHVWVDMTTYMYHNLYVLITKSVESIRTQIPIFGSFYISSLAVCSSNHLEYG